MASRTTSIPFYQTVSVKGPPVDWTYEDYSLFIFADSAACLKNCPDIRGDATENACLSTFASQTSAVYAVLTTLTPGQDALVSSASTALNDAHFTYVSCLCEKPALQPWKTGATGVCDGRNRGSATYTACAAATDELDLWNIDGAHSAYVTMCSRFTEKMPLQQTTATGRAGVEAEVTGTAFAGSTDGTTTAGGSSTMGGDVPTETGAERGDGSSGAHGGNHGVRISAVLLAGMLGLCLLL